jgi:alkylhydroperoxidase family enzyme
MTRTPTNDAGTEADALRQHFPDDQVVDIIATVALANLTNRITDGLGLELEFAPEKIE